MSLILGFPASPENRLLASRLQKAAAYASPAALLPSIANLELELGVLQIERRDSAQGLILRNWLAGHVLPAFAGRVLAVDPAVAQCCAKIHIPDPRSDRDAIVAATAIVHGLIVVTRNAADFAPLKVQILNPWECE